MLQKHFWLKMMRHESVTFGALAFRLESKTKEAKKKKKGKKKKKVTGVGEL